MTLKGVRTVSMPVMHPAAEAVAPFPAIFAPSRTGPAAISERLEAFLPNLPQIVLIYVALAEAVPVNVGTSADAAVGQDRSDVDSGVAEETAVADLFLIASQISLAAERDAHRAVLCALLSYEFHKRYELFIGKEHLRVADCPAYGNHSEQAPLLQPKATKHFIHLRQFAYVALVDAGHHVAVETRIAGKSADGPQSPGVAARNSAHPFVAGFQTVQAHRDCAHPCIHQLQVHLVIVKPAVGDDAPLQSPAAKLLTYFKDIRPQQRLTAGEDNSKVLRYTLLRYCIYSRQEILEGHVLPALREATVTAAMTAVEVAPGGALPEEVVEFVDSHLVVSQHTEKQRIHGCIIIICLYNSKVLNIRQDKENKIAMRTGTYLV